MTQKIVIRFLDRTTPPHTMTLVLLAGVSVMGLNIFLPSLPSMAKYFDTTTSIMGLTVGLYLAINGLLQLVVGPVSDKFGRRPVILWGLALFLVATVGCIYAPNTTVFLTFRMMQASVVVAMVLSRAVIGDLYPPEESGSKIAYVTMGVAVVPMISPALGGFLEDYFGWQASFWALFILGGAVLALCWADLGETKRPTKVSLLAQFKEYPELLSSPRFWGYAISSALGSGAFFSYLGGGPFVGSHSYNLSPTELGVFFGAPAVGYFIGNFLSGMFSKRFGINAMIMAGLTTVALGTGVSLLITLSGNDTKYTFFGLMIFVGLGNGLSIPNATAGALSVRRHLAGTASGLSGAMMLLGGAALSAAAGAVLSETSGAAPLLWIMVLTSLAGLITITLVIRRESKLKRAGDLPGL